jgi:tetratricopeptide (TPR) repeat protein
MKTIWSTIALLVAGGLTLAGDTDRGVELYHQGKYSAAHTELAQAVKDDPKDAKAQRYLGLVLVEQRKLSEAEEHLNQANELDPSGETKAAMARLYIERKDLDKAQSLVDEAEGPEKQYVKGLLHLNREQHKEATESLESYLSENPNQAYARYYAGLAYNGLKRPDKMLSHFELFLRLMPDAPEAKKVRAVLSTGR